MEGERERASERKRRGERENLITLVPGPQVLLPDLGVSCVRSGPRKR
jgi:hypothetical protein